MKQSANIHGTSDRTLLFVHGHDFKPAATDLLDLCIASVKAGIERDCPDAIDKFHTVEKRIAYYGDLTNAFLESLGQSYDVSLDLGDRRNVLQNLANIDKRKNFGVHRYDRVPGKTALPEFAADLIAPVLGKIGLSAALIAKVCVDLGEYWNTKSDFGDKTRERVRSAIADALKSDNQLMLLTHGTGCVIAYDALWELSHLPEYVAAGNGRKVDTWLTLGAPLGDSMVRSKLKGAKMQGVERYPSNVVSWYNVSAEDDYLSYDNTLADDFKDMLRQKQISLIRDYRIYNLAVRYGKSNPHSSVGYLIHPRVSQLVADWLKQGPPVTISMNTSL